MYNRKDRLVPAEKPYEVIIHFTWSDKFTVMFYEDYKEPGHTSVLFGKSSDTKVSAKFRAELFASTSRKEGVVIEESGNAIHVPITSIKYLEVRPA